MGNIFQAEGQGIFHCLQPSQGLFPIYSHSVLQAELLEISCFAFGTL